jgi:glycosyltransferase involved in cell wall biosynthesis
MIVLVPVYQPGLPLLALVAELRSAAPGVVIVLVDDGSAPASGRVLDEARNLGCTVLRHPANRGKGRALKTGFAYIAAEYPGQDVVCADADGQHHATDILRVAEQVALTGRMVLGVRRFTGAVPLRSRVGNTVTRVLFKTVTGRGVQDTQTGMRGYPATLLDWLCRVPGERFEYEMNVLLDAVRAGHPIEQTVVATTYLADNASSHFSSLTDSARIYWPLLQFAASSLLPGGPVTGRRPS